MVDHNTENKVEFNFARILVEVEMDSNLSDTVLF